MRLVILLQATLHLSSGGKRALYGFLQTPEGFGIS